MSGSEPIAQDAARAYQDATTGDFGASEQVAGELRRASNSGSSSWLLALNAQRWHAEHGQGSLPSVDELNPLLSDPASRIPVTLACAEAAKAAILTHQVAQLATWSAALQQVGDQTEDPWACAAVATTDAWHALSKGAIEKAKEHAARAQSLASQGGIAPAVIEATVLRALCAEAEGDVEEATALARRGSRMARTEDLPQWQYLASLVLARMRRLNGMPHLTTRILLPLLHVAPAAWHGWIAWEALMAGALELANEIKLDDDNDPSGEVRLLRQVLTAAAKGQTAEFYQAATALTKLEELWASRKADLTTALAAIDAQRPTDGMRVELKAWCRGDAMAPPNAIKGLCIDLQSDASEQGRAAFVVARPTQGSDHPSVRRIVGLGEPIVVADARMPRARGASERTPSTVAAIALAGPDGIARTDLFRTVYGFEYDHEVHRGLFKALVHRVRNDLGDWGDICATDDDRYVLELKCALVIPDPRCERSLEDVVLWTLASVGAKSAKETADGSGLPLRTTQRALKRLVESGALVVERVRNGVKYRVEDTTFSEPTKWQ